MPSDPPTLPHLLVVEDDPAVREALAAALMAGYAVHAVATGAEARTHLQRYPIAAIVLDVFLGEEDGVDLIPRLRAISAVPIVILTGQGSEELAVRAFRAGANNYLKKPPHVRELHAILATLLAQRGWPPDPVRQARHLLEEQLAQTMDIRVLAAQVGLSESYLRRRFREEFNKSPRRMQLEARLRQAQMLLQSTEWTVTRIAQEVGYTDLQRFFRVFRQATGMTPSHFRMTRSSPSCQRIATATKIIK